MLCLVATLYSIIMWLTGYYPESKGINRWFQANRGPLGKRYYDRADRPRIDAWQTIVNGRLGLHDPNAPENRRALVTPSALPETKQEAAQAITRGLLALTSSGELKTRQDVTEALESAGFEVVRATKSSISIADPDGGRNIRLKGAIYE